MKFTAVAFIASLASLVAADNCKAGLHYCKGSLLNRGNYQAQIDQAIEEFCLNNPGNPYAAAIKENQDLALFYCVSSDGNGPIFVKMKCCNKCIDDGADHSDYCDSGLFPTNGQGPFNYGMNSNYAHANKMRREARQVAA